MSVQVYILRRIILMLPLLLGVTLVTFLISHLAPIDPIIAMLSDQAAANPEIVESYRARWDLDLPLPEQYVKYVIRLLQGDWGISLSTQRPVLDDLARFFPATMELAFTALLVSIVLGIPIGILGALRHNRPTDYVVRVISLFGSAVPVFWLGLVALSIFYSRLNWLPGPGRLDTHMAALAGPTGLYTVDSLLSGNWPAFVSSVRHIFLPAVVLGITTMGLVARMSRASMLAVLPELYITTARAKGLLERTVILRHGLRNALIPTVTVLGLAAGGLMAGAVLTETIFSWPGLGRYAVGAAAANDYPAIMGVTLLIGAIFLLVNLVVDVMYFILDPRVRV